ncbi:hypothetical protein K504DRAFT_498462 [Pleomassaria siparia CBS 279.74]|uniref:Uncharacterized protein n=1 Tax=Pleomassaria siparia CBS 279.74 TaxID=1314801 RepID=A0A6G1KLE4_9PLEO|nr:hypothetical protein K504DRAFT_498462 [Pleomassaria siparia CBS 279.74]
MPSTAELSLSIPEPCKAHVRNRPREIYMTRNPWHTVSNPIKVDVSDSWVENRRPWVMRASRSDNNTRIRPLASNMVYRNEPGYRAKNSTSTLSVPQASMKLICTLPTTHLASAQEDAMYHLLSCAPRLSLGVVDNLVLHFPLHGSRFPRPNHTTTLPLEDAVDEPELLVKLQNGFDFQDGSGKSTFSATHSLIATGSVSLLTDIAGAEHGMTQAYEDAGVNVLRNYSAFKHIERIIQSSNLQLDCRYTSSYESLTTKDNVLRSMGFSGLLTEGQISRT